MHACAIAVLYFVVSINEIGNQIKLNCQKNKRWQNLAIKGKKKMN